MKLEERLAVLVDLGNHLKHENEEIEALADQAFLLNPWFTVENIKKSLSAISNEFLDGEKLKSWVKKYDISAPKKRIGHVLAGNIPLVGWYDVMCCFVAGHISVIKYSSKDDILIPALITMLEEFSHDTASYFEKVERLTDFDAIIATGGQTASTHFNHYFGKYPNIIRKNRSSCAIVTGDETSEEMSGLSNDIFEYFGLGCRSVSKVYLPTGL